ncbi:glycosyltransferase [Candidatus Woesearchaeota archaeon]|nr:glycosyltransferase [Candidatus Woesearchaeota archaeon]MCF7900981.1 glycosyltransferase [Candidatus Woesearchaeota archaeon]MCF8013303.1 glycosyltransferase [Candidatus Woesearchaeota archaeon]
MNIILDSYADVRVHKDNASGLEQMMIIFDKELNKRNIKTFIAGVVGSEVVGNLIEPILPDREVDQDKFTFLFKNVLNINNIISKVDEENIDLIHNINGPVVALSNYFGKKKVPILTNFHSPPNFDFKKYCVFFADNLFFSYVSNFQKNLFMEKFGDFVEGPVIHNGIYCEDFFLSNKEDYLLSMSRISPRKSVHHSIELAKSTNSKLKLAGRLYTEEEVDYHRKKIKPFLNENITYVGEASYIKKRTLYSKALATVALIDDFESFPLIALESLASGTPLIAYKNGPFSESVIDGETGLLVESVDEAIERLDEINSMDSVFCRDSVIKKFSVDTMMDKYVELYHKILNY